MPPGYLLAPPEDTYSAAVLNTPGLISYWRFNEPTWYTIAIDQKYAHDGTFTGCTRGVTGAITGNTAITIPTVRGDTDFVAVSSTGIIRGLTNWTVEAWINLTTPDAAFSTLYAERAGNPIVRVGVDPSNKLALTYRDDAGTLDSDLASSGAVNDGNWRHVAVTKADTAIAFYIDGQPSGTATISGTSTQTGSLPCQIGADPTGVTNTGFNGSIDEPALYNVAVPASTILGHFNAR